MITGSLFFRRSLSARVKSIMFFLRGLAPSLAIYAISNVALVLLYTVLFGLVSVPVLTGLLITNISLLWNVVPSTVAFIFMFFTFAKYFLLNVEPAPIPLILDRLLILLLIVSLTGVLVFSARLLVGSRHPIALLGWVGKRRFKR